MSNISVISAKNWVDNQVYTEISVLYNVFKENLPLFKYIIKKRMFFTDFLILL